MDDSDLPLYPRSSQLSVFVLTFSSYTSVHIARKAFSIIKPSLIKHEWFQSTVFLKQSEMCGLIDTLFQIFYGLGLILTGSQADALNLRIFIFWGMVFAALTSFLFGCAGLIEVHDLSFYAILWSFSGLVHSTNFPANVAIMGNWYGETGRGIVFGVWQASGPLGNIFGAFICSSILLSISSETLSWKLCMIITGIITGLSSLPMLLCLVPHPNDVGLPDPNPKKEDFSTLTNSFQTIKSTYNNNDDDEYTRYNTICSHIYTAWMTPGVAQYAIANACLKSVQIAFLCWLPFFLTTSAYKLNESTAGYYSILFDIGTIFGGLLSGFLADWWSSYKSVVVVSMVMVGTACIAMLHFLTSHTSIAVLLFFLGVFIGGPAHLVTACVATDIGHRMIEKSLLATVTGIIDGAGSIGASIVVLVIGFQTSCVSVHDGGCSWQPVFILLITLNFLSGVLLSRMVLDEL
eukprot:gene12569-26468_t